MEIKEVKPEEWKKVRDLYLELLKTDPTAFVDEYDEIALKTEEEWRKGFQRKGKTLVAVDGDRFVGMGCVTFYDELPGIPVFHKLGVLPEYRERGIGTRIVEARENWALSEGAKRVRLYVIADRKKTIEFSEKNGYKVTEILKNNSQRKDGTFVDVVIMEKDLS
ncbi:MAG: hypothetical protein A3D67_03505 [Candidatus Lloydbacteria bacterium RIFCSPHIGHO2_02_FULL_51_22]|uniref:N-acetyltransferase domain-containing protein n=2 Tax=Candidatus Lloydiibacteriota TaxID=1817910 RepID=A0A1G2DBJ0_9BACT|nr:MAG: hypothetical protein A3D67_03505 [Candidatus Lloydbacteria bacterium RIFCSPHIGHO2_02_FULL_51_22]OGZ15831.1 MAG: hypothetical protein A3G11_02610 [Candidatus Lloydbacteria bacterium RIFCSPLOWO2_12_FULL_51_9]